MKILVLGGSGFIGREICLKLLAENHDVTAIARNITEANNRMNNISWLSVDLATLNTREKWQPIIADMHVIINCAGALQDGSRDDVAAVQRDAMLALYCAATPAQLIIQISAAISGKGAKLPFITTKKSADQALSDSGIPYVILRPLLVVGRNAHGGTSLIRALAAFPKITPMIYADSPVQTIALSDLVDVVAASINGQIPPHSDITLAAPEIHTLRQVVAKHRTWLGLPSASIVCLPEFVSSITALIADFCGFLGWRSPLRSTAITIMAEGVTSDIIQAPQLPGLLTLEQTLAANPAGIQDLWFARLYLLKPLIIVTLALFWITSGVVALLNFDEAASHFAKDLDQVNGTLVTVGTSLADILLGCMILFRRFAVKAMLGMLLLSTLYLIGGTLLQPLLWADPLGPYVKVIPTLILTLVGLAIFNER